MFRRIKNIIRWLPILWKDHNFDYEYIFIILRHKLKIMKDDFNSNQAYGLHAKERVTEMSKVIKVLDRIIADDYIVNTTKLHDKKWGDIDWEKGFTRANIKTKEDKIKEAKEFNECCRLADIQESQDLDYLFFLLRKYIKSWWD